MVELFYLVILIVILLITFFALASFFILGFDIFNFLNGKKTYFYSQFLCKVKKLL